MSQLSESLTHVSRDHWSFHFVYRNAGIAKGNIALSGYGFVFGTAIMSIVNPRPGTPTESTAAFEAAGGRWGL